MNKFETLCESVKASHENKKLKGPDATHSLGNGLYGRIAGEPMYRKEGEKFVKLAKTSSFLGIKGKELAPTKNHRPAVYENMLGTVNAVNDKGEVKYFDYDYEGALKHAGVSDDRDVRIYKHKYDPFYRNPYSDIRNGQKVLWISKKES